MFSSLGLRKRAVEIKKSTFGRIVPPSSPRMNCAGGVICRYPVSILSAHKSEKVPSLARPRKDFDSSFGMGNISYCRKCTAIIAVGN